LMEDGGWNCATVVQSMDGVNFFGSDDDKPDSGDDCDGDEGIKCRTTMTVRTRPVRRTRREILRGMAAMACNDRDGGGGDDVYWRSERLARAAGG